MFLISSAGSPFHVEELAIPAFLRMNHIATSPATIRRDRPSRVSGSGTEFAAILSPRMEGVVPVFVIVPFPRMLEVEPAGLEVPVAGAELAIFVEFPSPDEG
jgi:hypothetical protein